MYEEYIVEQNINRHSSGSNIGVQNIYNGISPEKAIEITNKLFFDNFPKLQAQALEVVNQRMDEFQKELFEKLSQNPKINYSVFTDPDMQYILYDAEVNYARFGTEQLLNNLSSLIQARIEHNENDYLKIIIDSAIKVVGQLSIEQIDYLTVTFLLKNVRYYQIKNLSDLKNHYTYILSIFNNINNQGISLLLSNGCLEIHLGNVYERDAKQYGFDKQEVEEIMPQEFKKISGDYSTSDIGTVIAIINAEKKTKYNFNLEEFI